MPRHRQIDVVVTGVDHRNQLETRDRVMNAAVIGTLLTITTSAPALRSTAYMSVDVP